MNRLHRVGWCLFWLLVAGQSVFAGAAAERLHRSYRLLVEADALSSVQPDDAPAAYREAVAMLEDLQRQYPGWQHEVIAARLAHARNRMAALSREPFSDSDSDAHGDADAGQAVSDQAIDEELVWRARLARSQAAIRDLQRENMELKSRIRAMQAMPEPVSKLEIPSNVQVRLGQLLVDESDRLFDEQSHDVAVKILEAGNALWPADQNIRLTLGMAYCHLARFEEGARILRSLTREQPTHVNARLALGAAWMGLGNLGAARTEIEAVLNIDSGNADAHYNMARVLLLLPDGDLAQARRHYMQSVSLGGVPDSEIEQIIQHKAIQQIGRRR